MHLELKALGKQFEHRLALRNVSVSIPAGSRVALVGPNGSGKSTLLRAVLGLIECDGELLADGKPIYRDRAHLAQRIAYVPQVAPSIAASVGELVSAVARVRRVRVDMIAARAARLDIDLEELRRTSFRELSGGMRQKVLIALALAHPVDLLLMDEPTASLDTTSRTRFFDLCSTIADTTTVLLCSHRLDEIRSLTHRVLALRDGECVYFGPAEGYVADHEIVATEVRLGGPGRLQTLVEAPNG